MGKTFIKTYGQVIYRGLSIALSLLIAGIILYLNSNYVNIKEYKAEQAIIRSDLVEQQKEVRASLTSQQVTIKSDLQSQQVSIKSDLQSQQVLLGANLIEFQYKNTGEHLEFYKILAGINQTLAVINEQNKRIGDHEDRLRALENKK